MPTAIIKMLELAILLSMAVISDIRFYKIKNYIVVPFIFLGFITNYIYSGVYGLEQSLFGLLMPPVVLIILYALHMLGAGDIKLFSAIGAITGLWACVEIMAYSFISGGIIALFLIIKRKNGWKRIKYLLQYFKTCFVCMTLLPYTDFSNKSDGGKFHFAIAISAGVLAYMAV